MGNVEGALQRITIICRNPMLVFALAAVGGSFIMDLVKVR